MIVAWLLEAKNDMFEIGQFRVPMLLYRGTVRTIGQCISRLSVFHN